ncbi:MAG TPA: hypothetical protein GX510_06750 [Firmicutes bacterium]|nr:hypothetical protein [Candidatus Fermentithermobacillaceae bacterium]
MARSKQLLVLGLVLTLLAAATCLVGCVRELKPVPVDEGNVPEAIKEEFEKIVDGVFTSVKEFAWYIVEDYEGGHFVIATMRGIHREPTIRLYQRELTWYIWGHLREGGEGGQAAWGVLHYHPLWDNAPKFGGAHSTGYAAGWALDPRIAKIVLVRAGIAGEEQFSCTVKNGFWWTGPHQWGNYPPDRAIVYDRSGKVLYEGPFPPPEPASW